MSQLKAIELTETEYSLVQDLFLAVMNDTHFRDMERFKAVDFLHLADKFAGPFDEGEPPRQAPPYVGK